MVEKKYIKAIFYSLAVVLLLVEMVGLATAASLLQGNNQATGQTRSASACSQTYVVQRGDLLSRIAEKYLGSLLAYNLIFQATNAAVGTDGFTRIRDPNLIEPGQILCIPVVPAATTGSAGAVITNTTPITSTGSISITGFPFSVAPGEGVLLVENRAEGDFVFDLTQPKPGSALVPPNQLQPFIVPAGLQGYMAHHPIGQFIIKSGQVQVNAGQVMHLICFRHECQLASRVQASAQSQTPLTQRRFNQPVIAGQQPPSVDNNNDNDNDIAIAMTTIDAGAIDF
jgi:LysM repeat protein